MHVAGRFVAEVLSEVGQLADVGVNLLDLEHHVRGMIQRRGAESCYWDYAPSFGRGPFRNVICLSVNDAVLHGLPHDYTLRDGDVLSADLAVSIDGWVADSARTVVVGTLPRTCGSSAPPRKRWRRRSRWRVRATAWVTSLRRSGRGPRLRLSGQ
jgi:methionyl aminopeptidase